MKEPISSLQNPRVKQIVKLREKSAERQKQGLFIIEGQREIRLAAESGLVFREIFYCPQLIQVPPQSGFTGGSPEERTAGRENIFAGSLPENFNPRALQENFPEVALQEVSVPVFEKMAYREHSGGLIALAEYQPLFLKELRLSANPFLIILETVEKPGNLGAILRTADAAKADAVIVCDPKTDICNPNVIRSSLGCLFTTQVVTASSQETLHFLKEKNIKSYAAALTASSYYHETDLSGPMAIVMGTESTGLTEKWLRQSDARIKIPMRGKIDSLNVSTSCAIITFEAMRQRKFSSQG